MQAGKMSAEEALRIAEDRIEAARDTHFAEYGNDESGPRGVDRGYTYAARIVAEMRQELISDAVSSVGSVRGGCAAKGTE